MADRAVVANFGPVSAILVRLLAAPLVLLFAAVVDDHLLLHMIGSLSNQLLMLLLEIQNLLRLLWCQICLAQADHLLEVFGCEASADKARVECLPGPGLVFGVDAVRQ